MSRYHSYINTAVALLETYKGEQPFAIFIKNYFSAHKKYGSKDRKQIATLCYNYFRIGFAAKDSLIARKILIANFLCTGTSSDLLENLQPDWNRQAALSLDDKLVLLKEEFDINRIFPFKKQLSDAVKSESYCRSMLFQPSLFLRIRPQCRVTTLKKLSSSALEYQLLPADCIALPPATNADAIFIIDKEVVVQDINSQQVLNYLFANERAILKPAGKVVSVWDCCAASGGKSLLAYDMLKGKLDITVSDIRMSIVQNLHQRFKRADLKNYKYFIEDIADTVKESAALNYQLIICDAPCTGSGTWGRTPEQLCYFKPALIKDYADRQKKIVSNAATHLLKDGIFVYITCSVFKDENENIAEFITANSGFTLLHQEILEGFDKKGDTMFVAVFKK